MKISDLIVAVGAPNYTYEKVELVCNEIAFSVKIKKEMSAADAEFIFRPKQDFDDSYSYRRIHRLVLFVVDGGEDERPSLEQVMDFPLELVNCLGVAIERVQSKKAAAGGVVKKNLRKTKRSGTT